MKLLYCSPGKVLPFILYAAFLAIMSGKLSPAEAQTHIKGQVLTSDDHTPLVGATVQLRGSFQGTSSDAGGFFSLPVGTNSAHLAISFIGYRSVDTLLQLPLKKELILLLTPDVAVMNEVAVTGYQQISKERATGSFVHLDQQLLNRRVSTNILDRLDGLASGILFTGLSSSAANANPLGRNLGIRIRGESTLADGLLVSRDPLIVLDNFPFEGNLDNINPNDIESMTVLKDAAAASIWGARAGNGVIVITTKKGRANQVLKIEFNSNVTVTGKPNLHGDKSFLNSAGYLDAEQHLFDHGYFNADLTNTSNRPPVSPAVQLMADEKAGILSPAQLTAGLEALKRTDVRRDFDKYVYQKAVSQQYSLGIRGGSANTTYHVSAGYDKNISSVRRNGYDRFTLNALSTYMPFKRLRLTAGMNYSTNKTTENNYQNQYGSIRVGGNYADLFPYASLADAQGNPLSVVKGYNEQYLSRAEDQGFLDWRYRPLDEINLADNATRSTNLLLKAALNYQFSSHLNAEIQFQNERQLITVRNHRSAETYYVRDLINRFSVRDSVGSFAYPVPKGGILELNQSEFNTNNLRAQLNFDQVFGQIHAITAIAGAEARELRTTGINRLSYGYQHETGIAVNNLDYSKYLPTYPAGSEMIPYPDGNVSGFTNRFISYYANGSYTLKRRYTFTVSGRRDGANIFGAKTNDRITPLWSVGGSWDLSQEDFFNIGWIPYLKLRASYGTSGNVYQGSVYVKGNYLASPLTGALFINGLSAPNPQLKWETIKTLNLGLDISLWKERLTGTVEYYEKKGLDLIQNQPIAPSAGFNFFYGNSAATVTRGVDLTLKSSNLSGPLRWSTVLLISHMSDKITKYDVKQVSESIQGSNSGRAGIVGKPLYALYSYKWAGLDPDNGDPRGYLNGEVSKNYLGIINNFETDSLVYHGSAVPTWFGSLRNDFSYGRWALSVNLVYKLGYFFRRPGTAINYTGILSGFAHQDYDARWQKPGDEQNTQVPSIVYPANAQRNTFYQYSEQLVEKADHIRLQDIRLSYALTGKTKQSLPFENAQLYLYANNLGVLWRANKQGLDPDYVSTQRRHALALPISLSLGVSLQF